MAKGLTIPITFAEELRHRRMAAGLSLTDLAKRINYSKSHLCKIESGTKRPSVALARLCDQEFKASGALVRLVQPQVTSVTRGSETLGEVWIMRSNSDGYRDFSAVDRRTALTTGAATLMTWAITPPPDRAGAAESALPTFRAWLDEIRCLGQSTDPGTLSQILIATTGAIRALAVDTPPATRAAALRLASRYAEYTGWMAQEKGDDAASLWWTNHAVGLALADGDRDLASYALVRRAELALYRDDSIATVALAQRARAGTRHARIRSLAAQREAQGHALVGDEYSCNRALEQAAELASDAADGKPDEPLLGSGTMPDPLAFVTGWCLHDLGRSEQAAVILSHELERIPTDAHRTRARYGARLAVALATMREIDRACDVAEPVLVRAGSIDSATVRHDLRLLRRTIGRWRTHGKVKQLMPRLIAALHTNQPRPLHDDSRSPFG